MRQQSRFLLLTIASVLLHLAPTPSQANSSSYVWENSQGLTSVSKCEIQATAPENEQAQGLLNRVIEVKDLSATVPTGEAFFSLIGSFWQAVETNGQLNVLKCANGQSYHLFDVYIPESMIPVARVGVATGASIFKQIEMHSQEQAEELMAQRAPASEVAMKSMSIAADVEATEASLDYLTCMSGSSINVRDQTLSRVIFTVGKYQPALPVQSFGTDRVRKTIDGVVYYFIKVQFPSRGTPNVGWVADKFIKLRAECAGAPQPASAPISASSWTFPTLKRTTDSYKTGMRAFGASRSGGARRHAAADLYRLHGDSALSVTSGKVIRDRYYFYEGTYAIEVQHTGGKVVRYGEITGRAAPNVKLGAAVKTGQVVGYIGTVSSGCCKPMLHFEMYAGTKTGSLTQSGNIYNRRSDLMDPTPSLTAWEKAKFGTSY